MYSALYKVHQVHSALYKVHSALYKVHQVHSALYKVHSGLYKVHQVHEPPNPNIMQNLHSLAKTDENASLRRQTYLFVIYACTL